MKELFVPGVLAKLRTIDPGEIREVQLILPQKYTIEGTAYPVRDEMRPGTAFLAKPFGIRTEKYRRRMYTRSNCRLTEPGILETIINDTHKDKADTSPWWQTAQVEELHAVGGTIDVRVTCNQDQSELIVYESGAHVYDNNLRLESDEEWPGMKFLGLAFSTGITPFLAHVRHMKALQFGRSDTDAGANYVLIVSVRNPRQLMAHEELLEMEKQFPKNFTYHPVLTREWPDDWLYTTGRIIQDPKSDDRKEPVDVSPLLNVVPDISTYHVRMCGNRGAYDQLVRGLADSGQKPLSIRWEIW